MNRHELTIQSRKDNVTTSSICPSILLQLNLFLPSFR